DFGYIFHTHFWIYLFASSFYHLFLVYPFKIKNLATWSFDPNPFFQVALGLHQDNLWELCLLFLRFRLTPEFLWSLLNILLVRSDFGYIFHTHFWIYLFASSFYHLFLVYPFKIKNLATWSFDPNPFFQVALGLHQDNLWELCLLFLRFRLTPEFLWSLLNILLV